MEHTRDQSKVSLLVVDDIPENRTALRAMLGQSYMVSEAASGPEALRLLIDQEFAVLLVDVVMPEMSGYELAELIHNRKRTASIPILFITAVATEGEFVFRGYRAGAVDYLIKPLDPEVVRAKVDVFATLFRQRKQIESSLYEKEVLLREVHHRVKNNLQIITSLLHLQATTQPPPVRSILAESEARVRSIALVHESLYQAESLASIDIDHYLESLVAGLVHVYDTEKLSVNVIKHGVRLPIDAAVSCGLIANELVANALKHAFPDHRAGRVTVSLSTASPDSFMLTVRDNGAGIPEGVDFAHATSMGLRLVSSLSSQLGGTVELDRGREGTLVSLRFPRVTDDAHASIVAQQPRGG